MSHILSQDTVLPC